MLKTLGIPAAVAATLMLVGCGGGGAADALSGGSTGTRSAVTGPLTPVQSTVSSSVLQPLVVATAGTPLSGVVSCADFAVNGDALNMVNLLANSIQSAAGNPTSLQTSLTATAAQVQVQAQQLAADIQQMLTSLAGGAGCNSSGSSTSLSSTDLTSALSGTPLAPLLGLLAPLSAIQSGTGGAPSLSALTSQLTALSTAMTTAFAALPPSVTGAPVLGGVITALKNTTTNLPLVLTAAANAATSGNPAALITTLQTTVTSLLQGSLLNILPVNSLQSGSGSTALSSPITSAISALTSALGSGLSNPATSLSTLQSTLTTALAPVLTILNQTPVGGGTSVLTGLLSQLTSALSALPAGGSGASAITSLIGSVVPAITNVLSTLLGGTGGAGSSCLLSSIPLLSALCTAI